MPRLQSDVSAGKAGKKGAALNAVGDVPMATPTSGMLEGHQEFGMGEPGGGQLLGHHYGPLDAKGNQPRRGPGQTTPKGAAVVEKGLN